MTRILVVEDDSGIRSVLVEFLSLEGYEAVEAVNPGAAAQLLKERPVDLVITDTYESSWNAELPWLGAIREAAGDAQVVLLTAFAEAQSLDAKEHGLAAVWTKPMDMDVLIRSIERLLARDSAQGKAS